MGGDQQVPGHEVQTPEPPIPAVPFVGRDDELDLLRMLLARVVRERACQLVTVTGDAGVGKSRLLAEFEASLASPSPASPSGPPALAEHHRAVTWAHGHAVRQEEGSPFAPLADVVRSLVGVQDRADPVIAAARIAARVADVIPDEAEHYWFTERLGVLVGTDPVPTTDERTSAPDPGGIDESFAAWRRFLEAEAGRSPLALVLEDMHLATPGMLSFLEHVLDWSAGAPMLLLCTARPELFDRSPAWGGGKRSSTTVALPALPRASAERLVAALFEAAGLTSLRAAAGARDDVAAVVERSGGNPLYAEQFVRLLAERRGASGAARGTQDEATAPLDATDHDIPLPETVRELIADRLHELPPDQLALLMDAAVLGTVFWPDALAAMDGDDPAAVRPTLHELARKELVRPARTATLAGRPEYAFVHGLVRDVAYAETPPEGRWSKHLAAAEWLERTDGGRTPQLAEALAHHYAAALSLGRVAGENTERLASVKDRAARALTRSGDLAAQLDARRAEALFRQALALREPGHPDRPDLLARVGSMAALAGEHDEAARLLEEAGEAFLQRGRPVDAARTALDLSYVRWNRGGTALGRQALDRAFELLEDQPPGRELARATADRAADRFFAGDSEAALATAESAFQLANDVGAPELAARLLEIRGMSRCDLGDWDGLDDLHSALHACRDLGMGQETVRAYLNLGTFVTPVKGPDEALRHFTAGAELAERRGIVELGMWTKAWQLGVLFELGRWDQVLEDADDVLAWDRRRGQSQIRVAALNCKAEVLTYRGRAPEAARMARGFVEEARTVGDPQILLPALAIATVAAAESGDTPGSIAAMEAFADLYRSRSRWVGSLFLQVIARAAVAADRREVAEQVMESPDLATQRGRHVAASANATLEEARGEPEEALGLHRRAAEGWAAYGFPFERAQSLAGAARCLITLDRQTEAGEDAGEAAEIFDSLGATALAARARAIA